VKVRVEALTHGLDRLHALLLQPLLLALALPASTQP
jgi:hypothetical protein